MTEVALPKRRRTMPQKICNRIIKIGIGFVLALAVCSMAPAQQVSTNSMPGADFSKYHTYKWVTVPGVAYPNQIVDAQIKNAIDAQLSAKGLTKTDADTADLYIDYQVSISQQQQWTAYGMGGGYRWGGGMATAQSSTIDTGTLVLDMYDPTTKQLVWSGKATK